jgi:serine/threonine protein kinase
MPPEVLIGYTESTPKIDVWAIGIMLHAFMTGYFPFRSSNRDELKKQIIEKELQIDRKEHRMSDHCYDILVRMLDKDPSKRISIPEIMEHPWIVDLRKSKRKRDRGIFGEGELQEEDDTQIP